MSAVAGIWTSEEDIRLREMYAIRTSPRVIGVALGRNPASVRNRAYRLGITHDHSWPPELIAELRTAYEAAGTEGVVGLAALAKRWGRNPPYLCRVARQLGLTNQRRKKVHQRKDKRKYGDKSAFLKVASRLAKERIARNGHPRGMLGKRHKPEVKQKLRASSKAWWGSMSKTQREEFSTQAVKAAIAKNGRVGPINPRRETTWKAGWREIGDRRHYFRSRWEANYARYLEWLKRRGDIVDWEYEPETFWFEGIKRGVRSYLPDFRVHELNGDKPLHEVKGWMCPRSKTTLKRMAKYHPDQKIVLIREKEYKAISRFSALIGGWE